MSRTRNALARGRSLLAGLLLGLLGWSGLLAQDELRVCFLDDDLPRASREQGRGFDLEIMKRVAEGMSLELVPVWSASRPAFSEIEDSDLPLESLARGSCDAVASVPGAMAIRELGAHLELTRPYYGAAFELVGPQELPRTLPELTGSTLAVQLQSLGHYAAQGLGLQWKARPTTEEALALVGGGEADAALVWGPSLAPLGAFPLDGFDPPQALRFNEHVAVRSSDQRELGRRIDEQLGALLAGGVIDELARKYGLPARTPFESTSDRASMRSLMDGR